MRLNKPGPPALLLVASLAMACEPVPLMDPEGADILLQANPPFVIANGGRSVVTAVLTERTGSFVPDGTEVFFFTNLGRIDERARTVNGIARVHFVADARSGHAGVTAYSGGPAPSALPSNPEELPDGPQSNQGSVTIRIDIGSALPESVVVTANPQRIVNPRRSAITAHVFDADGNPVQNVPVVFTLSVNSGVVLEETLDSGGTLVFTDSNGQAFDTLRTRRLATDGPKVVKVTATTSTGVDDEIDVAIN